MTLNGTPITLQKFDEFNVAVQLTNYDGITNYKHFKDIKLSDSEDYVLELIVPPMLTRVDVRADGKLKTLFNEDVNLSFSEQVEVFRDENTDRFVTCHLNRSPQGYVLQLRGKNGEVIPNREVVVTFYKTYGSFSDSRILYSD